MKTLSTHIIRSKLILLIIVVFVFFSKNADAQRGRPYINFGAWTNGVSGTTFVADNGNLLRGMICGSNPSTIPQTTNYGCNAVHFYAESASGGTAGYNSNLVDSVVPNNQAVDHDCMHECRWAKWAVMGEKSTAANFQ